MRTIFFGYRTHLGNLRTKYNMQNNIKHYCVYTRDLPSCKGLTTLIAHFDVDYEMHMNRTRFWLDLENPNHMYLYMRYSEHLHCIDHETDHALGI